jgi:cholesterol oxidase
MAARLPRVSDRLGTGAHQQRVDPAVRLPEDRETWNDVAISCSIHVDHDTHIEFVNYGRNADFMSLLYTVLVGKGRPRDAAAAVAGQHRVPSRCSG